jgi:hypothetical protein
VYSVRMGLRERGGIGQFMADSANGAMNGRLYQQPQSPSSQRRLG